MSNVINLSRIPGSMFLAFFVTVLLFYLMQGLIDSREVELEKGGVFVVNFVKALKMKEIIVPPRTIPEFIPPEVPPEIPHVFIPGETVINIGSLIEPAIEGELRLQIAGLPDGNYLPIVKVQPVYPRKAQQRGIEGYTIVAFDVAADGSVRNPRVTEAEPGRIFNNASIKAALRFRYKPRIEDGKAVVVLGVQNRFTFEISGL